MFVCNEFTLDNGFFSNGGKFSDIYQSLYCFKTKQNLYINDKKKWGKR